MAANHGYILAVAAHT